MSGFALLGAREPVLLRVAVAVSDASGTSPHFFLARDIIPASDTDTSHESGVSVFFGEGRSE